MPSKMSKENAQAWLDQNELSTIEVVEFEGTRNPVKLKCHVCGSISELSRWDSVKKWKCPECNRAAIVANRLQYHRQNLDQLGLQHIVIEGYEGDKSPVTLVCTKCGTKRKLSNGSGIKGFSGCKQCDKKSRRQWTVAGLQPEFNSNHSPLLIEEVRGNHDVDVFCKDCHEHMTISNFPARLRQRNYNCPLCELEQEDERRIQDKIAEAKDPLELVSFDRESRQAVLECTRCHSQVEILANDPAYDFACPKCKESRQTGEASRMTLAKYKEQLLQHGLGHLDVIAYTRANAPVTLKCPDCGCEWTIAEARRSFGGCPECSGNSTVKLSVERLRQRMDAAGFGYMEIKSFMSGSKPADFHCTICGHDWNQGEARAILRVKGGCPKCHGGDPEYLNGSKTGRKISRSVTTDVAQARLDELGSNIELLEFNGLENPSRMKCRVCGMEWDEKWTKDVVSGLKAGCTKCRDDLIRAEKVKVWNAFVEEHFANTRVVDAWTDGDESKVTLECSICGNKWDRSRRGLKNEGIWGETLCEECNPRFIAGKPLSEAAYRKTLAERGDKSVICLEYNGNKEPGRFKCSDCGHEWTAIANQISVRGTGCPICHSKTSYPERALHYYLDQALECEVLFNPTLYIPGYKGYKPDVLIPKLGWVVEYDGFFWHEAEDAIARDKIREEAFSSAGLKVLHFREVKGDKGKRDFYQREPFWIDVSDTHARKYRNDAISNGIKIFLSSECGVDVDSIDFSSQVVSGIDVHRWEREIRAYWSENAPDKKFLSAWCSEDGYPLISEFED